MVRERLRFDARQAQKAAGLFDDVVEIDEAAALANDVQQIPMLTRRRIGLMCS